jgi:hypothetical protein
MQRRVLFYLHKDLCQSTSSRYAKATYRIQEPCWRDWSQEKPDTAVSARDPGGCRRYRESFYTHAAHAILLNSVTAKGNG